MAKIRENKNAKKNPYWFQVMVNGERVTRRGFSTKTEAKTAMATVISELSKEEYIAPSTTLFKDYIEDWIKNRKNIEETTRELYMSYFNTHIAESDLGKIKLGSIAPLNVQSFVDSLQNEKKLAASTVNRIYSLIKTSLNFAKDMEIVKKNAAMKVEVPKVENVETEVWSVEAVDKFLKETRGKTRFWIAYFLAIMTGLRQGELLGLTWADIDFEKQTISVKRSLRKDKVTTKRVKTTSSKRVIAISESVIEELKFQKERIEMEKGFLGSNYEDNDLVICSSKGTHARASKVLETWKNLCEKHKEPNLPDLTFHDLRHQHASLLLHLNSNIKLVSARLGHSNTSTTLNIYSHLMPDAQHVVVKGLDELFS